MDELLKAKKKSKVPKYGKDGTVHSFWKTLFITIGIFITLIGLLILSMHVPVLLYKPEPVKVQEPSSTGYAIKPDETGIRNMLDYVKDHQDKDFDNDGLKNADELNYATDSRDPDSDTDGVCDYAEIYIYNTRPNEKDDNILQIVKNRLAQNNIKYNAPYKMHDIIMWADDLRSRSIGTVIPTIRGYRFSGFNGWVQFPEDVYAYSLSNNYHTMLDYREKEKAWRIQSASKDVEVVLYAEPLQTEHLLELFGRKYFVKNDLFTTVFTYVLPKEHSFINFHNVVVQDNYDIELTATVTEPLMPAYSKTDLTRFGKNSTEVTELTRVYTSIVSGKPVAVSLQSPNYGEVICMVYGYTEYGDLLIANESGEKTDENGKEMMLKITVCSRITVDQDDALRQREYFVFEGMGFNSQKGDKISFIWPEK